MKNRSQVNNFVQGSLLLVLVTIQSVYGQQPVTEVGQCALTADQLADFRGLRLGMPEAEVRKLFAPNSKYRKAGVYNGSDQHLQLCVRGCEGAPESECLAAAPEKFPGLSSIHFTLRQKRVELMSFCFAAGAMPADALEFSSVISAALGLPNNWRGNQHVATLQCDGVRLRIEGQDENKLALIATPALRP